MKQVEHLAQVTIKDRVVAEARKWLNTPFRHQGRTEAGVDCLGLVIQVSKALGLKSRVSRKPLHTYDRLDYSTVPNTVELVAKLKEHLYEKDKKDLEPGDIVLMSFNDNPQHLCIVGDYHLGGLSIIHGYRGVKKVVEHELTKYWFNIVVLAFSVEDE